MRPAPNAMIEPFRLPVGGARTAAAGNNGAFRLRYRGATLAVICSDGDGWDHVSVSLADRCPTWDEMCYIKSLFFRDSETVVQFHPRKEDYINCHPNCLHLWRSQSTPHDLPPGWMIGPKS